MSKYKVGDIVKLRDDLEENKDYGYINAGMINQIKLEPFLIAEVRHDKYINSMGWVANDEMIEGLWEECKGIAYEPYEEKLNKLKLIDVLNMIAKGELKEGTKVKYLGDTYLYNRDTLVRGEDRHLLEDIYLNEIREECELIEPPCEHECISDDGITLELSKIEELEGKIEALGAVDLAESWMVHYIRENRNKLNEVINKVNAQTEVILAYRKDIDEIKEQLDY